MKHCPTWTGFTISGRAAALAATLLGLTLAAVTPAAAATGTITISGTVSCQSHSVVGVWVESGGGGSGWANWQIIDARHTNIATYQARIQNTSLPTNIRLHVGCGGKSSNWWSDNRTNSTSRAGGPLSKSTANLDAVCNEGTTQPPPGDNQRCWFGYASAAAAWAVRHLSGPGATYALPTDHIGGNPPGMNWSGMCLAFVASAYWTSGVSNINPIVYTDAKDMYQTYEAAGLIHFHSQSDSPPVGAFVFYPGLSSDGHIGISVGYGEHNLGYRNNYSAGLAARSPHLLCAI